MVFMCKKCFRANFNIIECYGIYSIDIFYNNNNIMQEVVDLNWYLP